MILFHVFKKSDFTCNNVLLSPAIGRMLWLGDYKTSFVHASIGSSVYSSGFDINLNISFIYKDIFTQFPGNAYGYENLSVLNFGLILKNKMATIVCLKIINML